MTQITVSRKMTVLATLTGSVCNTLIISIQAIVLVPFYLTFIGPKLYGAWLASGEILCCMQASDLGLPNLMIQRIGSAYGRGDLRSVGEYFTAGSLILLTIAAIMFGIFTAICPSVPIWMGLSGKEAILLGACFQVGALASAITIANNSVIGFSRGVQQTVFLNIVLTISALAGFLISLVLLILGHGLWSIVGGMFARAIIQLSGSCIYFFYYWFRPLYHTLRLRAHVLRELVYVSPVTAIGGFSYTLLNQSELAILAITVRPEIAAVYAITRRAVDAARGILDTIGYSSYGSLAHLFSSDRSTTSNRVVAQLRVVHIYTGIALAAAYMLVNRSLLGVWVGKNIYGGPALTILLGINLIVSSSSYLTNNIFRATGSVVYASLFSIFECAIRLPLALLLLPSLGLIALPLSAILISRLSETLQKRLLLTRVPGAPLTKQGKPLISSSLSSIVILTCAYLGYILLIPSWLFVLSVGFSVSTSIALALYYSNPLTRPWLISFLEPCLGRKIAEWKLRTRANKSYHQSVTVLDNGTSDGVLQPRIRNKDQQFTRWKRDA